VRYARTQTSRLGSAQHGSGRDETPQFAAIVVAVRYASGVGPSKMTTAVGSRLGRIGAVHGDATSLAAGIPAPPTPGIKASWLLATDRRVALASVFRQPGQGRPQPPQPLQAWLYWEVPPAGIVRVEKRPRLQLMARFRLHFGDGSSAAFMTRRAGDVQNLRNALRPGSAPTS
jgi:hypothetical protein